MSDKIKVQCPGCSKSYTIHPEQVGKKATCKACGERFVLQPTVATTPKAEPSQLPATPPPPPPKAESPKGFFGKLKQVGQNAARQLQEETERQKQIQAESGIQGGFARLREKLDESQGKHLRATDIDPPPMHLWSSIKFCGCSVRDDFGVDPKTQLYVYFIQSCMILARQKTGLKFQVDEVLRIPLLEIEDLTLETADRMTLGRIGTGYLLAGPFGGIIGGLWKKQDKFLRVDWGGNHSMVLGSARTKADALQKKILEAIRQVKESDDSHVAVPSTDKQSPIENRNLDISTAIRQLAALRDQGILTDEEFDAKKAELLTRM